MEGIPASEQELRDRAEKSLRAKRDFRTHVFVYIAVNAMLVVIWAFTNGEFDEFWPIFPIVGWGIGLAANAWGVYGQKPITEDEIQREAERLRR